MKPPTQAPNQKLVASWLAIGSLIAVIFYLAWLWMTISPDTLVSNPAAEAPELRLGWKVALWFIEIGTAAKVIFALLLTAISVGVARAAEIYRRKFQILAIVLACLSGVLFCILLIVTIADEAVINALAFYSGFESNAELKHAADQFFEVLIGWFSLFMVSQLGLSALSPEGWLKKLFS